MRIRRTDFILGLSAFAFSVVYLQLAGRIPDSLLSDAVGAAGIPRMLGWAMGMLGVLLCLRSVRFGAAAPVSTKDGEDEPEQRGLRPHAQALGLLAILGGYIVVAPYLGYAVSTGLLVGAGARYAGAPFDRWLVLIAVAAAAGFWVLFVLVFGISMPAGMLFEKG